MVVFLQNEIPPHVKMELKIEHSWMRLCSINRWLMRIMRLGSGTGSVGSGSSGGGPGVQQQGSRAPPIRRMSLNVSHQAPAHQQG